MSSANPKKQLKLVCLALVWLGINENSAFGDQLPYLHNMMCQPWKTLKLVCLALAWLGANGNTAFGTKQILPSQTSQHHVSTLRNPWENYLHSMMCQLRNAVELKLVRIGLELGTDESTAFGTTKSCLCSMICQPKKTLKLVCLTLAWLWTNENNAFRTNNLHLRNVMC